MNLSVFVFVCFYKIMHNDLKLIVEAGLSVR